MLKKKKKKKKEISWLFLRDEKERIILRKESIVIFLINVIFGFSLYNPAYIIIPF